MSATCTCVIGGAWGLDPCMRGAVAIVATGCVHEHVINRAMCDINVATVMTGHMCCLRCFEAGEHSHECRLSIIGKPQPIEAAAR